MNTREDKRILVIDDEKELLNMVRRILELDGYEVYTAGDGRSGLDLMAQCNPNLVLLDIMMPGLDGIQVLEIIREQSNVPVIMLTAKSERPTMRDTLELGADDYVTKPFGMRELLARIKAKMRRVNLQDQSEVSQIRSPG